MPSSGEEDYDSEYSDEYNSEEDEDPLSRKIFGK